MPMYDSLSHEARALLDQSMEQLSAAYREASGLVEMAFDGERFADARASLYYALGLLIRGEKRERAEDIVNRVLDLQIDAPGEVFHGVYRHLGQDVPPRGVLDPERLGAYGMTAMDLAWERLSDAFHRRLEENHAAGGPHVCEVERLLQQALHETFPVVWDTYEPNSREFVLMPLAMICEHFPLSPETMRRLEHSACLALDGAMERSRSAFTPLNTNIRCIHVFTLDYFGRRLGISRYTDYALAYARGMLGEYREFHACAEFNSPTYCGVDLSVLGFWRRYGSCAELRALGTELEEGIWRDMAAFYNPAMRNFCGPYSRAYELEMGVHTCFHALLHLALGRERFPWHPLSIETECNPLLVLGDVRMPEDVRQAFLAPREEVTLFRRFRELSERSDPQHNRALCTATAWITPDLMCGALSGSENPSHQLHPLVVFWRSGEGLGTIRLQRSCSDGTMRHMHTVFFDAKADRNRLTAGVRSEVERDVDVFFEIECDGLEDGQITPDAWRLPGLTVRVEADAPAPRVIHIGRRALRVCYPARLDDPASRTMHFALTLERG